MRFRHPEEIKKRVSGNIRLLNRRLLKVSRTLERFTKEHKVSRTVPGSILQSFFRKAVKSFYAVELLKDKGLIEEAWGALRVLLESHVNAIYFLKNDAKEMSQRFLDNMMLDKLKHLRDVNFYRGTPLESMIAPSEWEATESEIRSRYSKEKVDAMKRNGFTGLPFNKRAAAVGLKGMYAYYRIGSRNIHSFDPADSPFMSIRTAEWRRYRRELFKHRRRELELCQNMLLGRLSWIIDECVHSPVGPELMLIGLGYEKYTEKTSPPKDGASAAGETTTNGTFYVWREPSIA